MRVIALARRILMQLRNDKRTVALMLIAPLLILTLLFFVFEGAQNTIEIGVINVPENFVEELCQNNAVTIRCESPDEIENGKVTAVVTVESGKVYTWVDGSNSTKAGNAIRAIEAASIGMTKIRTDLKTDITYVYGSEDLSLFDNFNSILMGFLVFF